jgi:hypothetical protein
VAGILSFLLLLWFCWLSYETWTWRSVRTKYEQITVGIPIDDLEEQPAACQGIEPGGGISAWDKDAFPEFAVIVLLHGDPVSGVFCSQS